MLVVPADQAHSLSFINIESMLNLSHWKQFLCFKQFDIKRFSGLPYKRFTASDFLYWQHFQVAMWVMSWQPEMLANWLNCVRLARLSCTTKVRSESVGKRRGFSITTLPYIGRVYLITQAIVLSTVQQVHPLVCAGDVAADSHCLAGHWAGVLGYHTRLTVLAQYTLSSLATLSEPYTPVSTLAVSRRRKLCPDQNVSKIFGTCV